MEISNWTNQSIRYPFPWKAVFGLASAILNLKQRSFREDAVACVASLQPALKVLGKEFIPSGGPALLTVNHYYRPGFQAWWLTLAISAVVPGEVHWVITAALTFPGRPLSRIRMATSRWLLARIARVYRFSTMPAMPPRAGEALSRAQAVREVIGYAKNTPSSFIGLAPEGQDNPHVGLMQPPPGAGRFILHLSRAGFPITPVGAFEAERAFTLHFGRPYRLEIPEGLSPVERDLQASRLVMARIAALLPSELRGDYR